MIRLFFIMSIMTPLLACATDTAGYESAAIRMQISAAIAGKSKQADRNYWHALLKWSDECESDFNYPETVSGIEIYPESDKQYIVQVMCTFGSYQGRQQFFSLQMAGDKAIIKPLQFPVFDINKKKAVLKESSAELWGNVLNSSDHNKFTILNLYSGYGHCGTLTTYSIINGEVTATKLLAQPDCESKNASRDPEKWPGYSIP